jgi:hypothetical protein
MLDFLTIAMCVFEDSQSLDYWPCYIPDKSFVRNFDEKKKAGRKVLTQVIQ